MRFAKLFMSALVTAGMVAVAASGARLRPPRRQRMAGQAARRLSRKIYGPNGVDPNDPSVWDWSPAGWRIGTITTATGLAYRRTPTSQSTASI
jgi:hypothetical protein